MPCWITKTQRSRYQSFPDYTGAITGMLQDLKPQFVEHCQSNLKFMDLNIKTSAH
jgi:hypothetical protein